MREYLEEVVRTSHKTVPFEIYLLLLILGLVILVWDIFDRNSKVMQKQSGLGEDTDLISIRGSAQLPSREFRSSKLGLSSKPDALFRDGDYIIPVDVRPMTRKVRDRHVLALLVHMRLIEDNEGHRPPYGVLLMGPKKRMVKIQNSEDKQRWLDSLLDEMRSILNGVPANPAPAPYKCRHCDVHAICDHSLYRTHSHRPE